MTRLLFAVLLLLAAPLSAAATVKTPHTEVTLAAASAVPAAGQPLRVGIVMTPQPGWHTYWLNPGDAGVAPRAAWTLPHGATASGFDYPVPGTFLASGLMNYVYGSTSTLLAKVAVPAGLNKGTPFPVGVKLDWLVCSDTLCVPESATLDLPLTIGDGRPDPVQATAFAAAQAALPKRVDWPVRYAVKDGRIALAVPFGSPQTVRHAYFFAAGDGIVDYATPQTVSTARDLLRLETKAAGKPSGLITGLLKVERADGPPLGFWITARPGPVAAAGPAIGARDRGGWPLFAGALLLAVAGGVLLNVMPCVFPILSLKALSLARGGISEAAARRDALAYAAGVVLVCIALGGSILLLRAGGTQVGWAFQLQDPRVILLLLLLTTSIALNLAGLFEVALPGSGGGQSLTAQGGAAGSFWTGALAAFVATPCAGPFMAGALGAALVLPPLAGLLVFAGLGLGLALPFLAIAFIPALRRRLPSPGPWMLTLRRVLAVPMFLTAAALAWVLGRQAGVPGMTLGLLGALVLGLALWWLGLRQRGGGGAVLWPVGIGLAAAVAALLLVGRMPTGPTTDATAPGTLAAEPFSAARLAALQAAHRPAFVYFTADWCLTCKVNERGALASDAVAAAFKQRGVTVLVGDWTNGDAAITAFLDARGRSGVPLYLFYARDGSATELPQLLTTGALVAAVEGNAA